MKFIKKHLILFLILVISLFLRIYNLPETMQFIPDQGWFYLSAKDMITTSIIPLVGPPTSHPWIHHGPLWTYALGVILLLFNFDPIAPGYFIALLGTLTVGIFFYAVKKMFSEKIAIFSSILYATSPLIVLNSRIPYHTSPIPFFVILLFFVTYLWIKGKIWVFPLITFLLGVLYNYEITTFVYALCTFIILLFGIITKKDWAVRLSNIKLILVSIIGFIVPMTPFILYDISHGYKQTAGFFVWMLYRIVKLPLSILDRSFVSSGSNPSTIAELFSYYKDLIFSLNTPISFSILAFTIFGACYILFRNKIIQKIVSKNILKQKFSISYVLLCLYLSVSLTGLFVHRIPIEADTLLIAPFVVMLTVVVFFKIFPRNEIIKIFILGIATWNSYILISSNYFTSESIGNRISYKERIQAIEKIIKLSEGEHYTIVGKGDLSDFPVFTMPYEYLLWWKGYPISKNSNKKIIIWENHGKIEVYKND